MLARTVRSLRLAAALAVAAAGCTGTAGALDVAVVPTPDDLAFARVRIELAAAEGISTWERTLHGGGTVRLDPGTDSAGTLRVWCVTGPEAAPTVVAYGEASRAAGARRVTVDVSPASDADGDWVTDDRDDCPTRANPLQLDGDADTVGDACDDCPADADPEQRDVNGDTIGDACATSRCGDGVTEAGEQCDDGNTARGDGCSDACRREEHGNGFIDPGEACDDGNTVADDGCSNVGGHTPASVALDGPVATAPQVVQAGAHELLLVWTSADDAADPQLGDVVLQVIDPAAGTAGRTTSFGHGTNVRPFHAAPATAAGTLAVVWTDLLDVGAPSTSHARVRAARLPADLSATATVADVLDVEGGLTRAWGTFAGPAPAAFAFDGTSYTAAPGRRIDVSAWPPAAEETVGDPVLDVTFTAGAVRTAGGWLAAWVGAAPDRPASVSATWIRRFDADGAPVDPADTWLADRAPGDQFVALYEPATDAYLVGVLTSSTSDAWFRVPATGGAPEGPTSGDPVCFGATYLAAGDGTIAATWIDQQSSGCVLHVQRLDASGLDVGAEVTTNLGGAAGVTDCSGTVAVLADGRALVAWRRVVGTFPGTAWSVHWWLAPSLDALLE